MIECVPRRCRSKHVIRDCNTQDYPTPNPVAGGNPIETFNHGSFCNYFWKDHDNYVVDEQSFAEFPDQQSSTDGANRYLTFLVVT